MAAQAIPFESISASGPPREVSEGLHFDQGTRQLAAAAMFTRTIPIEQYPGDAFSQLDPMANSRAFLGRIGLRLHPAVNLSLGVVSEIDRLLSETDDGDEVPPAEFAYRKARSVVEEAYTRIATANIPIPIPDPVASTDYAGDVRLNWHVGRKQVGVNFGAAPEPQRPSYIYFESPTEYNTEALTAENLAERLSWLVAR
jgi:hypothetical protein